MLRVGLTGGIGSGKSTAARRLVERGAVLVDADALAREVVEPGTDGLAAVVAEFGEQVLGADGALDRPALAALVFGDDAARERLNRIVHPRVRQRSAELMAAAPAGAVLVQDIPLLVEGGMAAAFALVIVVHADAEERVRRLVELRGMPEADARSRIAVQASDDDRRAAADVWLDNSAGPDDLVGAVDALWDQRLAPFADALRADRPAAAPPRTTDPDPGWAAAGARVAARVAVAAGERGRGAAHVGPTAVPGLPAADELDLLLAVEPPVDADPLRGGLREVGFVPVDGDRPGELTFRSADPGRAARLHVREAGSPAWRAALLRRDWLRADAGARSEYRTGADGVGGNPPSWWERTDPRAEAWATAAGWAPPP